MDISKNNKYQDFRQERISFGPEAKNILVGNVVDIFRNSPLKLKCGKEYSNIPIAFQTHGELNSDKSNAILICHALTGDQYVLNNNPVTGKEGWWQDYIGSGKAIDTDKYFVICPNVIGGCMGSFGPKSLNPETGCPYNLSFPVITIEDMVEFQHGLISEHFGINKLHAVVGGSMGGMQALQWLAKYPQKVTKLLAIATSAKFSAQNIAFNEIGRQSIIADANWHEGSYSQHNTYPDKGLAIARMMAHVTYMSESKLAEKFGRKLQEKSNITYGFDADFQIESYLRYQGRSFIERFDPNSYLYITRAMDYFDLAQQYSGDLTKAFVNSKECQVCVVSFSSDWMFTTAEAKQIIMALSPHNNDVSFVEIETDLGHDAFLLPNANFYNSIEGFLNK